MRFEKTGSRGVTITVGADESPLGEYCMYLINGDSYLYLCDTFLGPQAMEQIRDYIAEQGWDDKPMVIFFSHSDWDHVWGASAFANAAVIAHDKCAERMIDRGQLELERYSQHQQGQVKLVYPGLTFENRLRFREDGVEFFYTPGHTVDSAICFDRRDSVLFVGDMVEKPKVAIGHHDLETYIDSLELIKGLTSETMISSHSGQVSIQDVDDNIQFIREFQHQVETAEDDNNLEHKLYTLLLYEDAIEQTEGNGFDYMAFQRDLWASLDKDYLNSEEVLLRSVTHEELELALQAYMAGL